MTMKTIINNNLFFFSLLFTFTAISIYITITNNHEFITNNSTNNSFSFKFTLNKIYFIENQSFLNKSKSNLSEVILSEKKFDQSESTLMKLNESLTTINQSNSKLNDSIEVSFYDELNLINMPKLVVQRSFLKNKSIKGFDCYKNKTNQKCRPIL